MKSRVIQDRPDGPERRLASATSELADPSTSRGVRAIAPSTADRPVGRIGRLFADHQFEAFVLLALALSWWRWPLYNPAGGNGPIEPLGPAAAAFIVVALSGRGQLGRFARQVANVRSRPIWLLAAVLVPIAMCMAAVAVNTMLGAPAPSAAQLAGWTALPLVFVEMFVFVGLGEEIGWTAFGAPRALLGRRLVVAGLLLAGIRVLWHLPVVMTGQLEWVMLLGTASFQLLILWMYRRSGGRWLPAAVFHGVLNTVGGPYFFAMVEGPDRARLATIFAAGYALLAIVVLVVDRRSTAPTPVGINQ